MRQLGRCSSIVTDGDVAAGAAIALIALLAASVVTPAPARAESSAAFTAEEAAQLAAGKLVKRPKHVRNGANLIGGTSWRVIDAPRETVWRALHDFGRYPEMMPQVVEARALPATGAERDVYVRNGHWPIFASYYLLLRDDHDTFTITFRLDHDRPHSVNECWGFVRLVPYGSGRTLMAFGVLADLGHGILTAVGGPMFQDAVLSIPSTVKKFIERGGAERADADREQAAQTRLATSPRAQVMRRPRSRSKTCASSRSRQYPDCPRPVRG